MCKVTIVSALFDIERVDGRPWEEYLKWFEEFLKLKTPMILFVSQDVADFIENRSSASQSGQRGDIPTEVVIQRYRGELTLLGSRSENQISNDQQNAEIDQSNQISMTDDIASDLDDEIPF